VQHFAQELLPGKDFKTQIDTPFFAVIKSLTNGNKTEITRLKSLAKSAIDTCQRKYAVFKVRGGCVDDAIQNSLWVSQKLVQHSLDNVILWIKPFKKADR
jgi:hypothetical protein